MPVAYTNRKSFTYFLNKGVTKTGKPRYYFARELKDEPVEKIPKGYKIQESVNGIVSLVKERPQLILADESKSVEAALKRHPTSKNYRIAVKDNQIIIYEGTGADLDGLRAVLGFAGVDAKQAEELIERELDRYIQFAPVMRFILDDQETRQYHAEHWSSLGSIDDWTYAGHSGKISELAEKLIPMLGTNESCELY